MQGSLQFVSKIKNKILKLKKEKVNFILKATWQTRESELAKSNVLLESPDKDLIDEIWPSDERPSKPNSTIRIHDIKFAGILLILSKKCIKIY